METKKTKKTKKTKRMSQNFVQGSKILELLESQSIVQRVEDVVRSAKL